MKSNFTAAIAWRYLLSKKSHGAVGTISTVSICAMSVATAAIICVLSVFNGFKREIGVRLDTLLPDISVTAVKGKTFGETEKLVEKISKIDGVELATPTLSDNALVIFNSQEMPVKVKGVNPEEYAKITSITNLIPQNYGSYLTSFNPQGEYSVSDNTPKGVIAIGVAARLMAYPESEMLIFAPRREGRVNLTNPSSSFQVDSIFVTGIYQSEQSQFDDNGVILPIETVRKLLQYDDEASAIEIKAKSGIDATALADKIQKSIGDSYVAKDRMRQQEMNFRMINIEKWVSFLLLGFILIIASFNLISSLSMLVIEKENALSSFSAMGLSRRRIGSIFAWESIYVSLTGGLSGIIIGLILCLLQQHLGLIKIGSDPSATVLRSYPVEVVWTDVLITLIPVLTIGLITAGITAAFARSRIKIG